MIYTFKISLMESSKPIIWRRVRVNSNTSFETFHYIIQSVFTWRCEHLYIFYRGDKYDLQIKPANEFERDRDFLQDIFDFDEHPFFQSVKKPSETTYLQDVFKKEKEKMFYEYDFGDSWLHKIELEKIEEGTLLYPVCIKGKGKTPPENSGGIWGYYSMLDVLKSGKPKGEFNDLKRWLKSCGYNLPWDENEFSLEDINEQLISDIQNNFKDFRDFEVE